MDLQIVVFAEDVVLVGAEIPVSPGLHVSIDESDVGLEIVTAGGLFHGHV
jgi:hypothetical protein